MSIWRWAEWMEPVPESARITLGEGQTPLVRSRRIGPSVGLKNLFFKLEISQPTGSYKDRFAAAAIAHMIHRKQRRCIATSSGNTGSALAAYCAAAEIDCLIAIVETAPEAKLQQMLAYGARLMRIRGFGLDPQITAQTMNTVAELGRQPGSATQVSAFTFSPLGMEGVKTLGYELAEQAEMPIEHVFCPAGGGGLTLAVALGFHDLVTHGRLQHSPRIHCVQPQGNDTMASAINHETGEASKVTCTTQISGLQVPNVLDGHLVVQACRASGGSGHLVSDAFTWSTQKRLAREEGIFCEPAGAVALAGALQAHERQGLNLDSVIVCCITGSGFKDPPSIQRLLPAEACPLIDLSEFQGLLS